MHVARSLHSVLRPFTQILREMVSPTMTVISVWVAFAVVSDQSSSNRLILTPNPKNPPIRPYIGPNGDSSLLFHVHPK